jgi:hypothetical protein
MEIIEANRVGNAARGMPRFDRAVSVGLRIVHLEFWQEQGAVNTVEKLYAIAQINPER